MNHYCLYKIDDRPYCCWEYNVIKKNLEFINSIDSEYFLFQTDLLEKELEGDNKKRAAISIRNIYHHALETFMILTCSLLQAPYCLYAWMFQAKTNDIRKVIRKINDKDSNLFNMINLNSISWEEISYKIHFVSDSNKEYEKLAIKFAKVWNGLAQSFLDDYAIKEYNAIKHGLRTSSGGFKLKLGPANSLSEPSGSKDWVTIGNSKFGSSFIVMNKLKENNFQSKKFYVNWDPKQLIKVILLISISIKNISQYLKIINGEEGVNYPYLVPDNDDYFNIFWDYFYNCTEMQLNINIRKEDIEPFTYNEISELLSKGKIQ
ncbi:MAG TPA: hypothetical protein VFF33_14885 [Ignavibacteriaceae bacterium]|nr:hypothetical protein [Ignavibacteriaceae bacterium]